MNARWESPPSAVLPRVVDAQPLSGGAVNDVWRLILADGTAYVLKGSLRAPVGPFPPEAEGLRTLHERADVRTPLVFEVSAHHLLMEALRPRPDSDEFWESAGGLRRTARGAR